jgi:hypothetical protein
MNASGYMNGIIHYRDKAAAEIISPWQYMTVGSIEKVSIDSSLNMTHGDEIAFSPDIHLLNTEIIGDNFYTLAIKDLGSDVYEGNLSGFDNQMLEIAYSQFTDDAGYGYLPYALKSFDDQSVIIAGAKQSGDYSIGYINSMSIDGSAYWSEPLTIPLSDNSGLFTHILNSTDDSGYFIAGSSGSDGAELSDIIVAKVGKSGKLKYSAEFGTVKREELIEFRSIPSADNKFLAVGVVDVDEWNDQDPNLIEEPLYRGDFETTVTIYILQEE